MSLRLETPSSHHAEEFVAAVRRSRVLHRGLVTPPKTRAEFHSYVDRMRDATRIGHLIRASGILVGVININEIVRGSFQCGYLGYYAFAPHNRRGYMTEGMRLVLARAFRAYRLHRLEANIQPTNVPSIALVERLGFRREGFSPRYLRVAGRWRDHERWALTIDDWKALRRSR